MLRLTLGLGAAFTHVDPEQAEPFQLSGLSGSFSLDIGGSVAGDLLIHARFAQLGIFEPSASGDGQDVIELDETTSLAYLFGGGATYYFMPINLYVSGVVGLSWLSLYYQTGDQTRPVVAGFGINLDVGKEWWLSNDWGVGVAARFWHSHVEDRNRSLSNDVDLNGFAVLLSATFQ
jgi:hypothetical protein